MPDYRFVVNSSFKPYSFDEMLKPWVIYSNAYEKAEDEYTKLSALERFKDLVDREGEEEAAKIYNAYAEEYNKQYKDFAQNGLNISNRGALTGLKRRYKGEIGALEEAEKRLNAERKMRDEMRAKGLHMLYNNDNLTISSYLHGKTPNQYGISTDELYAKGAAAGKAFTSRLFDSGDGGSIMNGYYRKWVESQGLNPDNLNKFQQEMMVNGFRQVASSIPELQQIAVSGLEGLGVYSNLSGDNLRQAEANYLNGIIDGAIYKVDTKPIEDKSKMTPYQQAQLVESRRSTDLSAALYGKRWDGRSWIDDSSIQNVKGRNGSGSGSSSSSGRKGTAYENRNKEAVMIGSKSGKRYKPNDDAKSYIGTPLADLEGARALTDQEKAALYDNYGNITNNNLREVVGDADLSSYEIYVVPSESTKISGSGWLWNDKLDEDVYIVVPRDIKRQIEDPSLEGIQVGGTDDIPD